MSNNEMPKISLDLRIEGNIKVSFKYGGADYSITVETPTVLSGIISQAYIQTLLQAGKAHPSEDSLDDFVHGVDLDTVKLEKTPNKVPSEG